MKIHFLADVTFPKGMAGENHVICQMKGLVNAGADVELVLTKPAFGKNEDIQLERKGVYENMPYNYINGLYHHPNHIVKRLNDTFVAPVQTFFWLMKNVKKNEVLYQYGGSNFMFFCVLLAYFFKRIKFVHEIVEIPFLDNKFRHRVMRWVETRIFMPHFDGLVCISHGLYDYCKRFAKKKAKFHMLPILVEDDTRYNFTTSPYDVPYIIHTGAMDELKDGISYILKAFAQFKQTDKTGCRLVFTGPSSDRRRCKYLNMIDELGIADFVDLKGMIPSREELLNLQHFATMSVVYKVDNIRTRYCFATKIGEILMAGVPLVTTNATENKYYFNDKENAFLVEPKDIDQLATTIEYVLSHPEESREVGKKGKDLALVEFSPNYQGEKLAAFLKTI